MDSGRLFFGLLLVAVGGILLLDRLTGLDAARAFREYWPAILVLVAVIQFATQSAPPVLAGLLGSIGLVLLGWTTGVLPGDFFGVWWPLLLVAAGLWLIVGRVLDARPRELRSDRVAAFAAFGGFENTVVSQSFKGGSAAALFGGVEIDLTAARLDPAGATLEVGAAFGSVEMVVPGDWVVRARGVAIFGGWANRTGRRREPAGAGPELVIRGAALFGGVEVRN